MYSECSKGAVTILSESGDGYDDDFEKVVSISSVASESKQDTSVTEEISGLEDINITSDKPNTSGMVS